MCRSWWHFCLFVCLPFGLFIPLFLQNREINRWMTFIQCFIYYVCSMGDSGAFACLYLFLHQISTIHKHNACLVIVMAFFKLSVFFKWCILLFLSSLALHPVCAFRHSFPAYLMYCIPSKNVLAADCYRRLQIRSYVIVGDFMDNHVYIIALYFYFSSYYYTSYF